MATNTALSGDSNDQERIWVGTDAGARLGVVLSLVGLAVLVSEIEGSTYRWKGLLLTQLTSTIKWSGDEK